MSAAGVFEIPADWLAGHPALPDRCVKHGRAAQQRVDFFVRSRPPQLAMRKIARKLWHPGYSALELAEEHSTEVRSIKVHGWPLCAGCVRRRRLGITLAAVLFFAGLAAIIGALIARASISDVSTLLGILFMGGFGAMLLSPWPLSWAALPKLTQTQATPSGDAVHVEHASPEFTTRLRLP